jgi:very-short-patch-repair endonuclease
MAVMVTVECENCGKPHEKPKGEHTRSVKLGRRSFCGRSCSAQAGNAPKKKPDIVKACALCSKPFTTSSRDRLEADFCSRSCASAGSMSEKRRAAQRAGGLMSAGNLLPISQVLKKREAWKYAALKERLVGRPHEFEFEIGGRVFDLALFDTQELIEFDGPYHRTTKQKLDDELKGCLATEAGWVLRRVVTESNTTIPPDCLQGE